MNKLNSYQAAVIGLYTGILCGPFEHIHALAEELVGHSLFTHDFASEILAARLKELVRSKFLEIACDD